MLSRDNLTPGMQYKYDSFNWDFTKNLGLKTYCPKPFNTILIDNYGDVYNCICQGWLPVSVGNIRNFSSLSEILKSDVAQELQGSIADGSYRYCDVKTCDFKDNGEATLPKVKPKTVVFAMDDSCNLTCPSCREEFRFLHKGKDYEERMQMATHVGHLISESTDTLELVFGDGEVFASTIYKQLLATIDTDKHQFKFQTNGSLLKDNWHMVQRFEHKVKAIHISVDAGSPEVYHQVRRGGQWSKLYDNLHWIVKYCRDNNLTPDLQLSFCVQTNNCKDIVAFSNLCTELGVRGELYPINDWGTWHNFNQHAVWKNDHPLYNTMKDQLQQVQTNKLLKIHGVLR